MKALVRVITSALLLAPAGCSRERWEPVVYPDNSNLLEYRRLAELPSLEECRKVAREELLTLGALDRGDYECGRNCESIGHAHLKVCEETLR